MNETSLPFKARVGVEMKDEVSARNPLPLLTSPLKGEEPLTRSHCRSTPHVVSSKF